MLRHAQHDSEIHSNPFIMLWQVQQDNGIPKNEKPGQSEGSEGRV